MVAAYVAIALACVHVYLGTIGMNDAYRAMRDGYVDASWAKHHHCARMRMSPRVARARSLCSRGSPRKEPTRSRRRQRPA